jgi:hypothetical protein
MSSQSSIREKLDNVVSRTSANILPILQQAQPGIKVVGFQYGPWEEITEKLIDMTKNSKQKWLKFPLIAITETYPITQGKRFPELTMQAFMIHHTSKTFDSAARDGKIFQPILEPLKAEFLKQLALSKYFYGPIASKIEYTQIDNKFIGKENIFTGSPVAEYIDFIHMKDLKLLLNSSVC